MMRRVIGLLLVLAAAVGAAACGSSSKSSGAASPPATQPRPGATQTAATPPTPSGGKIPASTPITAPVVRAKFIAEIIKGGTPPAAARQNAGKITDCSIVKLRSEGVETAGGLKDAERLSTILVACAKRYGVSLK